MCIDRPDDAEKYSLPLLTSEAVRAQKIEMNAEEDELNALDVENKTLDLFELSHLRNVAEQSNDVTLSASLGTSNRKYLSELAKDTGLKLDFSAPVATEHPIANSIRAILMRLALNAIPAGKTVLTVGADSSVANRKGFVACVTHFGDSDNRRVVKMLNVAREWNGLVWWFLI